MSLCGTQRTRTRTRVWAGQLGTPPRQAPRAHAVPDSACTQRRDTHTTRRRAHNGASRAQRCGHAPPYSPLALPSRQPASPAPWWWCPACCGSEPPATAPALCAHAVDARVGVEAAVSLTHAAITRTHGARWRPPPAPPTCEALGPSLAQAHRPAHRTPGLEVHAHHVPQPALACVAAPFAVAPVGSHARRALAGVAGAADTTRSRQGQAWENEREKEGTERPARLWDARAGARGRGGGDNVRWQ